MVKGKAWKYGNNINTDIIAPPESIELSVKEAAAWSMRNVDPEFAGAYQPGDIFVAEHNLGSGSSRETAPLMLKELGVRVLVAMDYARIFYRNCINVGMIPVECPDTDKIRKGDIIEVDFEEGKIYNRTTGETYPGNKIPAHIVGIMEHGGLIPYLMEEKIGKKKA